MADGQWYYCLTHHTVEPYDGCKSANRLGPYATREEAAQALSQVEANNEKWDEQERAEKEAEGEDPDDSGWSPLGS